MPTRTTAQNKAGRGGTLPQSERGMAHIFSESRNQIHSPHTNVQTFGKSLQSSAETISYIRMRVTCINVYINVQLLTQ